MEQGRTRYAVQAAGRTAQHPAGGSLHVVQRGPLTPRRTGALAESEVGLDKDKAGGVTGRAILLGALLIPLNCFWVVRMERVGFGPYPSTVSLFANVVFVLFVLRGLNAPLRRWAPQLALSQAEMLTLYTMLAVSTGLAGLDGVSTLSQIIPHGAWFATAGNGWATFLPAFPDWLVVRDRNIVSGHYLGHSTFYQFAVLHAWAGPIFWWTLFVTTLLFIAHCLNVLVRPQWADRERLTFPIIVLPLAMTDVGEGSGGFFQSKVMWAGFALAAGLSLWNGLTLFVPTWPAVPLGITDLQPYLTAKPWNAITWLPVTFYPFVIGLGFLLPLDLLFSCVFFFIFWNAQTVATRALAWDTVPDFPFVREQGLGSLLGLFAFYVWTGRRHYAALWQSAWKPGGSKADGEALSPRAALLGVGAGALGLFLFAHQAGAAWWVALLFLAIYLATVSVVTRIRAELGAPVHDFHFMGGDSLIPRVFGATALRHTDMAFLTCTFALDRAHRGDTMPVGLEGLQMAHMRRFAARRTFGAIMLATVLGCLGTFWAFETQAYRLGAEAHMAAGTNTAREAFSRMQGWSNGGLDPVPNGGATTAVGVGLLCALVLAALRLRIAGFPLHPIGYAVSSSWAIHLIWFPLLIAWVCKGLTLYFGGLRAFRRALPFALGLILGDCVMGSLWGLIGLALNVRTYNFFGA